MASGLLMVVWGAFVGGAITAAAVYWTTATLVIMTLAFVAGCSLCWLLLRPSAAPACWRLSALLFTVKKKKKTSRIASARPNRPIFFLPRF
jgi:hypothetical protein